MYKNRYDWSELEKIAPPEKWLQMYSDYQELLQKEDVAGWWQEQYFMADRERTALKEKLNRHSSVWTEKEKIKLDNIK